MKLNSDFVFKLFYLSSFSILRFLRTKSPIFLILIKRQKFRRLEILMKSLRIQKLFFETICVCCKVESLNQNTKGSCLKSFGNFKKNPRSILSGCYPFELRTFLWLKIPNCTGYSFLGSLKKNVAILLEFIILKKKKKKKKRVYHRVSVGNQRAEVTKKVAEGWRRGIWERRV